MTTTQQGTLQLQGNGSRLSHAEVLTLEVPLDDSVRENPWTEFIGMFEGDAEFAEMSAQWQAKRNQHTDDAA